MGALIELFLILFFIFYPVWMFIKLAIYGKGIFFPNFEQINCKMQEKNKGLIISPDWTSGYGKFSYYLLLLWNLGYLTIFLYIIF